MNSLQAMVADGSVQEMLSLNVYCEFSRYMSVKFFTYFAKKIFIYFYSKFTIKNNFYRQIFKANCPDRQKTYGIPKT